MAIELITVAMAASLHERFGWLWELGSVRSVRTREGVRWMDSKWMRSERRMREVAMRVWAQRIYHENDGFVAEATRRAP